ncbi:hypothetical protein ABK040_012265 [Willaertia magna]
MDSFFSYLSSKINSSIIGTSPTTTTSSSGSGNGINGDSTINNNNTLLPTTTTTIKTHNETSHFEKLLWLTAETSISLLISYLGFKYLFTPLFKNIYGSFSNNNASNKSSTVLSNEKQKRIGEALRKNLKQQENNNNLEKLSNEELFEKVLNSYEKNLADLLVLPEEIDVGFEHIGGIDDLKNEIYESVCFPLKYPHLYQSSISLNNSVNNNSLIDSKIRTLPKGVLLYGPPGTGKTSLAKAIAKECGCCFLNVKREQLSSMWYGESEKVVSALFSLAQKIQPCLIFIDEIESLLPDRTAGSMYTHEVSKARISIILSQWDGFETNTKNSSVMIIGATNVISHLDKAALRRLPLQFHVGPPNRNGRLQILKLLLENENVLNVDLEKIADLTDNCTGSDLTELCKKAVAFPIKELIQMERNNRNNNSSSTMPLQARPLTTDDFIKARTFISPSGEESKKKDNIFSVLLGNQNFDLD